MTKTHVLVASSHPLLCSGVRAVLTVPGSFIVTEVRTRAELAATVRRARPDVCLMDEDLNGDALAAVRELGQRVGSIPVIVLADECTEDGLLEALFAGAQGYLSKDVGPAALSDAVGAVLRGEPVIARRLTTALVDEFRAGRAMAAAVSVQTELPDGLTAREREVFHLVRAGLTTRAIAGRLFVTPGTVRSHVHSVVRKSRVAGRAALLLDAPMLATVPRPRAAEAS